MAVRTEIDPAVLTEIDEYGKTGTDPERRLAMMAHFKSEGFLRLSRMEDDSYLEVGIQDSYQFTEGGIIVARLFEKRRGMLHVVDATQDFQDLTNETINLATRAESRQTTGGFFRRGIIAPGRGVAIDPNGLNFTSNIFELRNTLERFEWAKVNGHTVFDLRHHQASRR